MKKIRIIFMVTLMVGILATSCEKEFLNTTPTDKVSAGTAVTTTGNAMSALNGIHRAMYIRYTSQGRGGAGSFNMSMDELGEDMVFNANSWATVYRWISNSNPTDAYNTDHWAMHYKWIANANVLINGVDDAEGEQSEKDIIKGQALLYRAYAHYQLVQLWAGAYIKGGGNTQLGVPIKLDNATEPIVRSSVEDVYTQINKDIDDAITLLQGYTRPNKSHFNQNVAKGLKARVALTQGNWTIAAQFAGEAKVGYTLMDATTHALGFRDNMDDISEFMWASHIIEDQTNYFGNLGAYISRNYSSSAIRANPRSINSVLYNMIPATDVRATLYDPTGLHLNLQAGYDIVSNAARKPYTNQKFLTVSTSDSRMDITMMRAAEMYLIEAEAYARNSQPVLAAQALYDLVSTRDTGYTLSTNTGQALIDEILLQRRIELWGEGFRFFDLKRLNLPLDRTGTNHTNSITAGLLQVPVGDNRWIWAIPQDEINANPLADQNPI